MIYNYHHIKGLITIFILAKMKVYLQMFFLLTASPCALLKNSAISSVVSEMHVDG